jgi:transposase
MDLMRPFLLSSTKSGDAPERMREILNAVPYVLSTGGQWRVLPKDLPPRSPIARKSSALKREAH